MNDAYYAVIFLMMILIPLLVLSIFAIHLGKSCNTIADETAFSALINGRCDLTKLELYELNH